MKGIRISIAVTLGWLLVLYNLERFHEPINIASYIYVACGILGTCVVLFPRTQALSFWSLLLVSASVVALKPLVGYDLFGEALPLTITETLLLLLTVYAAQCIGRSIHQAQEQAKSVAAHRMNSGLVSFEKQRSAMYLEVRRARKHQRPLTMVTIRPNVDFEQATDNMPKWLEVFHADVAKHYAHAHIAELLIQLGEGCVIVADARDYLILLLPEFSEAATSALLEEAQQRLRASLDIDVCFGRASFPEEEVTLEGLIERAAHNSQLTMTAEPVTDEEMLIEV